LKLKDLTSSALNAFLAWGDFWGYLFPPSASLAAFSLILKGFALIQMFQPLEGAFECFRRWMNISLAHYYCTMTCETHDRKGVGTGFSHAREERMPEAVEHEIGWQF